MVAELDIVSFIQSVGFPITISLIFIWKNDSLLNKFVALSREIDNKHDKEMRDLWNIHNGQIENITNKMEKIAQTFDKLLDQITITLPTLNDRLKECEEKLEYCSNDLDKFKLQLRPKEYRK